LILDEDIGFQNKLLISRLSYLISETNHFMHALSYFQSHDCIYRDISLTLFSYALQYCQELKTSILDHTTDTYNGQSPADANPQTTAGSAGAADGGSSGEPSHKEVTVFTRIQEKSQWDMSQLVLDLDTKEAEIQILQSVLSNKESVVRVRVYVILDIRPVDVVYNGR